MENRTKPSILEANNLYLILGMVLLSLGSYVQGREIYSGLLITEYILILLPNLLYLKYKRYPLKKVLRLNRISFKQIIMVITITIFTYPLMVFVQAIFLSILTYFKEVNPTMVPIPQNSMQYIIGFFVIAITPGICEEIMFRGVLLDAYEKIGHKKAILITAFLFSIFHFNILNVVGPFILGIIFGIMVYKTNSIYTSIIGHTVNNGIALTLGYMVDKYYYLIDGAMEEQMETVTPSPNIAVALGIILFLALSLVIVVYLLRRLSPIEDGAYAPNDSEISIEENTIFHGLKYIPVYIILLIFIFVNWKFVLI